MCVRPGVGLCDSFFGHDNKLSQSPSLNLCTCDNASQKTDPDAKTQAVGVPAFPTNDRNRSKSRSANFRPLSQVT